MQKTNKVAVWLAQIRAPFLILAVFLTFIGLAFAFQLPGNSVKDFNPFHAVLLVVGVLATHISVNLFNEFSDYKTRIDLNTPKTPFSGGSGMLQKGLTRPSQVLIAAVSSLVLASLIGIYFSIVSHWFILIISMIGGITIVSYTEGLAKIQLGELFSGLALGSLVVIGTYIAMTAVPGEPVSDLVPLSVILVSIPPGILTTLLLFLNEFPDAEADKAGGRRHLVITLGKKKAGYLYAFGIFLTFGTILVLPLVGLASPWLLLALLPLPLGIKSSITAIKYGDDLSKLVPAMGGNVITVLATDLLLAVSIMIAPAI